MTANAKAKAAISVQCASDAVGICVSIRVPEYSAFHVPGIVFIPRLL